MCATEPRHQDLFNSYEENKEEQENEVTALESIFEGHVRVISRPGQSPTSLFCLQLDVTPRLPDDGLRVDVIATPDDVTGPLAQASGGLKPVAFHRSDSGYHVRSSIHLNHVPPLTLQVMFPAEYPSDGLPWLCLSSPWLQRRHLVTLYKGLCDEMEVQWGSPMVYSLADWLQENTFQRLGVTKALTLTVFDPENEVSDPDVTGEEGVGETCDGDNESTLFLLLRHDYIESEIKFRSSRQECGVCLDEVKGHECVVMSGCRHVWCRACLQQHCVTLVQDGAVNKIRCPEPECDEVVPVALLRDLLTPAQLDRWERLSLQQALDVMGDIDYCSRCNMACVRDEDPDLKLATCVPCHHSFCTACREPWHQGNACVSLDEKVQEQIEELKEKIEEGGDEAVEFAATKLRRLKEEAASFKVVKETAKPCPSCSVAIVKIEGCNMVMCTYCGMSMCWRCGKSVTSYDHFSIRCQLFDTYYVQERANRIPRPRREVHAGQVALQNRLAEAPDERRNLARCPRCHQPSLRGDNNNHIRCWQCRTNYCFLCHQPIKGIVTAHFIPPSPCKQHGDS